MIRVKICGIRNAAEAAEAAGAGADAIGLIFAAESRRRVAHADARRICRGLPPFVTPVAVVVNEPLEALRALVDDVGVRALQLHGEEPPEFCARARDLGVPLIKALPVSGPLDPAAVRAYPVAAILLDTHRAGRRGGTGETFDWAHARPVAADVRVILSGGLSPDNVAAGIETVRPYAVDVSSGVESGGGKDPDKIRRFVAAAHRAAASLPVERGAP